MRILNPLTFTLNMSQLQRLFQENRLVMPTQDHTPHFLQVEGDGVTTSAPYAF